MNEDAIGPDGRAEHHTKCPKRHDVVVYYTPAEWMAGLTAGTLTFACATCGESFLPDIAERSRCSTHVALAVSSSA